MVYARVHDQTVADDYYTAMANIEQRLQLAPASANAAADITPTLRTELLELVTMLAEPELSIEQWLDCVEQLRLLLLPDPVPPPIPALEGRASLPAPPRVVVSSFAPRASHAVAKPCPGVA
jgi:hypothetical protein